MFQQPHSSDSPIVQWSGHVQPDKSRRSAASYLGRERTSINFTLSAYPARDNPRFAASLICTSYWILTDCSMNMTWFVSRDERRKLIWYWNMETQRYFIFFNKCQISSLVILKIQAAEDTRAGFKKNCCTNHFYVRTTFVQENEKFVS